MAIPGWADYYRDRILKARAEMEAEPDQVLRDDLYNRTMASAKGGFGIMGMLPSPDSVRVVGEFLYDERGRYVLTEADQQRDPSSLQWLAQVRMSNCEYAVTSLNGMKLVSKPVNKRYCGYEDVAAWRQWYERIKSGNATFRFEGDPTEYDLDGPAPPEKLKRIAAARQRDGQRSHRQQTAAGTADPAIPAAAPSTSGAKARPLTVALAAILAVLAAGAWYFLRRRSSPTA